MKNTEQVLQEILDRVVRIETRIVQLMYYQGATPNGKYDVDDRTGDLFKGAYENEDK